MNIFSKLFSFSLGSRNKLEQDIADPETRHLLVDAQIRQGLPLQIKAMREAKQWTQTDLAEKLGTTQNAISRLENPRTGKPTITTLERIAEVFDVALIVKFASFSEFIDSVSDMSESSVSVPTYAKEAQADAALKQWYSLSKTKTFNLSTPYTVVDATSLVGPDASTPIFVYGCSDLKESPLERMGIDAYMSNLIYPRDAQMQGV